ncbi:hypothetical protein [Propioniciclava flava]|uniref:DUF2470 domain-containing protein n=1 Tax=Propioniciclava flava TaxID=2072026 RepID=A0A4Q2EE69_9ACTN|nr:hypothetical protein [Propioniciclava flava]RXW31481.1 hypothetical protein C1706_11415 [Propioniciclava flava]
MSMSYDTWTMPTCDARVRSLVMRMLSGAAAASLYAYRMEEALETVTHGLMPDGSLVVAAAPTELLSTVPAGFAVDVRVDLLKQSPDPMVSLVAASTHLLGSLTWASRAETIAHIEAGALPPMVEAMLTAPGARLGFVDMEKVVLHDLTGATPIPLEALEGAVTLIEDPYAAFDLVARHDNTTLKDLCWAVMVGTVPGFAIQKAPLPHVCSPTADQVFCVDVDPTGITVMLVGRHETLIAYARFATPATSHIELTAQVDRLMADATPRDALAC